MALIGSTGVLADGCSSDPSATKDSAKTSVNSKQVFWGDLHVHSGYSLDAWGFGTATSPAQAYAFAKGEPLQLADGSRAQLSRPLDFMSVTDHAEWFDLMYLCTDPERSEHPYCDVLTEKNTPQTGSEVFGTYVLPTITAASPQPTPLCVEQPAACVSAQMSQWQRVQQQANAANEPCKFTSLVGFEWSATPDYSHNHRNVIFASDRVTAEAIDYMRFPTPEKLWRELDRQCKPEDGCSAVVIPHNTNMGDGKSFDIETESPDQLRLRAKYESLVEIHQEKGNSECLPVFGATDEDCSFERYLTRNSRPMKAVDYSAEEWQKMRGGYVRGLLLRGLAGYERSGAERLNPLQLGIIGSTDNHLATGGFVDEASWAGTAFGLGSFERAMARIDWNPGGLVAVWAERNTRRSIFAALQRREVYATSGPRMRVRLLAASSELNCAASPSSSPSSSSEPSRAVPMGGEINAAQQMFLRIEAQADQAPLASVEVVRGQLKNGELREEVVEVWQRRGGAADLCVVWRDKGFDKQAPTFWYARVLQAPTPRWSAWQCQREGRCEEFPKADRWIRERAWTSPVWYLPESV